MPRWKAEAKKREEEKKTEASLPQSSSVKNVNKKAQNSTFMGGGTSVKKTEKTYKAAKRPSAKARQVAEEQKRRRELEQHQNQKTYGDQKRATPRRTTTTSNNLTQHTTAAQRQKMGMPTTEDIRQGREHRRALANSVKDSVRRATSEENKSFMQRQKSGIQTEADRQYSEKLNQRRAEVAKNTGRAATKGVQDTLTGYGKTLADVDEMAKSNKNWTRAKASKMGISEDDTVGMAKVEAERQESIKQAQELRRDLAEKQDKRQAEFDERTKNAKGLEKAWYGAVESGTGMATDALVGALTGTGTAGSLASMAVRTYGTTRGQAEKEGATENEDRAYAVLQAAKEVGTELLFPGAGLAKKTYGNVGLSVADRVASKLTKGLTGSKADLVGAGVRLLGGTAEENAEELAGWGLDPVIKELAYGKNVRTREAQNLLKQESDELRSNLKSADDARSAAAYLGSDRFLADNIAQYKDAGLSDKQAREVAEKMRDYLTASLTGDTDRMGDLEDEIVTTVAGGSLKAMIKEYDVGELMDTFASTSVLTLATGLPATATTAMKGAKIRENLGSEGLRALSQTAINFEDDEASLKGQAARDRLDSGKDLTSTQVFDLAKAQAEQIQKDEKRVAAMSNMADNAIKSEKLVTPKIGFRENGSVAGDEIITMNYVNESNNATEIISDLLKEEGSESLTDTEVQTGSRAIAGFKTGAFTINDANALNYTNTTVRTAFEAATGVNLSQYVVRKNGQVDIPATNAATKDALFAMAADNFVKTAQAETANWMDSVKGDVVTQVTERMGAQGSLALQQALDDVDERDRSTYMMNANAADMMYQTARNMGTEWDSVKAQASKMFPGISETKLEAMYNAGLRDRADAANGAIGQQVRMGEAMALQNEPSEPKGKVFVDTTATPKGTVVRTFSEIANNLGVDIHLVDDLKTSTGGQANGQYVNGAIYINMNSDFESNIGYIFMHEVTHHLKQYAPEQFNELENLVREKWFGYNPEQMQNEIAKKIDLYKRNGQTLSEEEALEEIIADAAHEFINDRNFANQVAEQNPDIAKAILNGIRNALRMLRRLFAAGSIDDETHMNSLFSQLNILDEAEKLWLNAYTQAVQNKAAVAIDEWQDNANTEEKYSITRIIGPSGKDYGIGVVLDSKAFDGLSEDARKKEMKTIASSWGGKSFYATDPNGNAAEIFIIDNRRFINKNGKSVQANKDLKSKNNFQTIKQESIALADELIETARYDRSSHPKYPHGWIDNYGKNNWEYWTVKAQDKEGSVWDVVLNIANDANGEKQLYDIGPIKKVERAVKSATASTRHSISEEKGDVNTDEYNIRDGKARWTDDRIDSLIREYGASNPDYSQAYAVMMNPRDFLKLTLRDEMLDRWNEGSNAPEHPEVYSLNEEELRNQEQTPFLTIYSNDGTEVQGHEGRHRMRALLEAGVQSVPVVIRDTDTKYSKVPTESMTLTAQDFGYDPVNNGAAVTITDLVPIKESNRDELIQKFGGNAQVRFSMSEPVERVKDLIAVHNLKPDDIRNTFELGGFPMPSIAVTKDSMGHDLYGDITLMFHSDTIDPEFFRSNQVFGGDAWTPTFPSIAKKISRKVADKVDQKLRDILGLSQNDYTLGDLRLPALDDDNLTNALRYNEPYEAFKNDEVFQIAYLKNAKNYDVAVPTKEGKIRNLDKQALEYLDDKLPELTYNDIYDTVDHTMEYEPAVRQARKDYYESKGGVKLKALAKHLDEKMGYSDVIARLEATIKFRDNGIPEITDQEALRSILNEKVDQEGYKAWIDDLFDGIIEKTGIRNDKDMFTSSGNRRSWESLHDPVTLENVVKVMRTELAAGGTGIFGSNPKGAAQKQYKSLDEIRADEDRLQKLSEEEYKAQSEEAVGKMSEVCVAIAEHNPKRFSNRFGAALDVGSDIAEILNSTRNRNTIQRKLKKDYLLDVTDEQMDDLMEAIDAIANLPTGYFEAKPRRAVGFDEVKAAIIPQNIDEDIKAGLSERGISSYEYDPDVEGDRTAKVNEAADAQNLRFSITDSEGNALSEGQVAFFADSKMVDAEGKLKPMYHGTENEFYEFDIAKAYPGTLGRGFYFTDSDSHAGVYGKTNKYYLNLVNPLMPGTNIITKDQLHRFVSELAEDEDYGLENYGYGATVDSVVASVWGKSDFAMLRDLNLTAVGDFAEAIKVFNRVNDTDYDGIITDTETIAFYPQQVKSVDNLNPTLSKDTRYSITDSDGKELSDGQVEYFKNSQARDAEGRLVPVYHTTNRGGFTVFDPSYSDDKRSLFFASNWNVSQTYGYNANREINLNPPNRIYANWAEVEKDIKDRFPQWLEVDDEDGMYNINVADALNAWVYRKEDNSYADDLGQDEAFDNWIKKVENGEDVSAYYVTMDVPDPESYEGAIHIKADNAYDLFKKLAEATTTGGKQQRGYYSCYLNLENPLVVDAEGHNWNDVPYSSVSKADVIEKMRHYSSIIIQRISGHWQRNGNVYRLIIEGERKNKEGILEPFKVDKNIPLNEYGINDFFDFEQKKTVKGLISEVWRDNVGEAEGFRKFINRQMADIDGTGHFSYSQKVIVAGEEFDFGGVYFTTDGHELYPSLYGYKMEKYHTRELAEIAQSNGYDGVIIRNCRDIGGVSYLAKGSNPISDIYIAFSSNQVKDINNENPTENPDIRYSIPDDDEAMSHMAHDYAYDNSYEALAHYEEMIAADEADETVYQKAKNYIAKDVDEFYAGLTRYADGMKFDDPILEEGRTRMAKSKQDFFNSTTAKWNDRWLTDDEVLDIKSVKKAVRDLVTGTMLNSNTNRKYSQETVKKTLIDMRLAYFYAKQGRTDVADALLWHSAHRMIDGVEFYREDGNFETYKRLRDYFKDAKLQLGEDYWNDVDYAAFRKMNFGRLNLVRGKTNLDKILDDLYHENSDGSIEGIAVEWFNPEAFEKNNYKIDSVPDILLQIADVLDTVEPYAEAYSSEYCAEWATDIASDLLDIMQSGKELQSTADKYKKRYDEKAKAMKARHAEAMLKVRQQRDKGIKRERAKFKEYVEKKKEKQAHNKYFDSIQKSHKKLTDRLLSNTADSNIPQQYKKELAKLLAAFDLQTVGSKKVEARRGVQGQKTIKMAAIKTALNNIESRSGEFHVSDAITDIIDELLGKDMGNGNNRGIEGMTIDELNSSELARIDKLLKALVHEFNTYKTVKIQAKRQQVEDIGKAQVNSSLEHAQIFGQRKDYQNITGVLDKIVNMGEMTPAYMFRMLDPNNEGIGLMWKEIRRSFDRYVRNQNQLNDWMDEIIGEYHQKGILWNKYGSGELSNWRSTNYQQTFVLTNGSVTLTPAQMMSLYCLSKRNQAYGHMVGAGIVVAPVSFQAKIMSDVKKKADMSLPVILTDADIKHIVSKLTPDQIKVADKLQELMATKMAAWGNEASMNVLGIELFGEPDYFPIKSDKAALEKDLDADQFANAIRSFGFTKAVQPGARNAIMIDDIFDVVAEHCNNMNLYNSYSEAMNDFMKVYNYRDFREDGREYTVQQAIAHAYSRKATTYIMQFMKDLNGNVSGRSDAIENAYNTALGNAKKAAVFANLRVAAQQPTAIVRAFAEIDPKYIKGIRVGQGDMKEMMEHCPIALWKSWGYYDINMGKSIEDIMMNNGKWLEDKATDLYGALDNVTWTAIWQMVKAETREKHPELKEGTDEFFEHCNERMSEIVDFTQVVDSPMHRSHDMRSKNMITKLATSFMAEPTLTFNMVKDGMRRAYEEYEAGSTKKAAGILQRTFNVFIIQAGTVAAFAAAIDALRKKKPDKDDEDDRFLHLWWVNALENFKDNLKLWNNIYFVKDIASMFEGWDNNNLALQGWKNLATGWNQLTGNGYVKSSKAWYENMAYGLGYLSGVPVKTIMTGISNFTNMFGVTLPGVEMITEELDALPDAFKKDDAEIEPESMAGKFISIALSDDDKSVMDKVAEKMGYKPIGSNAVAADKNETKSDSKETKESSADIEKQLEEYRETLSDNLSEDQKDKLVKQYKKTLEKEAVTEAAMSEDFDVQAHIAEAQANFDYEMEKRSIKAAEMAAGKTGRQRDEALWDVIADGYTKSVESGNMATIQRMREEFAKQGGDTEWFDAKIADKMKSAYKKTIYSSDEIVPGASLRQETMYNFMTEHGVSEKEISDIVYHSYVARDLKAAMRIGNEDYILDELVPLVAAGLSREDYEKLYKYRNMGAKTYDGKYTDQKYTKTTGTFVWPTEGVITSHFGWRNAPTAGASSNHPAIDIGAPSGTTVVAADGGVVITAGANGGYGNSVGIKHANGMVTYYNHLSAWNVKVGDQVAQGQPIANVGSTGISTGPHLDFKILDADGNPVDPEKYLKKK